MKNFFKKLFCSNSMSKHFSETVQRIGKNNAGFSLVELIVVIAIMAILAAVAVVGVSVYIPKTQKAADEQMIADIQTAINLYTAGETLTPGQSGYVVVHKAGGVSVGGDMETTVEEALVATFGEGYANELKVSYQKWTGTLDVGSATDIVGSSYYENTADLLDKVQSLTNALSSYYGGSANAQQLANQATLDIANSAKNHVDADLFIKWWAEDNTFTQSPSAFGALENVPTADNARTKFDLAAMYARAEAFVLYSGCSGCKTVFDEKSADFNNVSGSGDAALKVKQLMEAVAGHINGCPTCPTKMNDYFTSGIATTDAKAFLALMGQVDNMSDTIKNSEEFKSDDLFNSDFVVNAVGGYVAATDAFANSGAQDGDIVVIAIVDNDGNLTYKVYPTDY